MAIIVAIVSACVCLFGLAWPGPGHIKHVVGLDPGGGGLMASCGNKCKYRARARSKPQFVSSSGIIRNDDDDRTSVSQLKLVGIAGFEEIVFFSCETEKETI